MVMMSRTPDQQVGGTRADARRRHLLDVARTLFIEQGFHQTGIAQIASVSGIKVGQIYRDFESKEAIIAAICEADVITWLEEDVLAGAVAAGDMVAVRAWLTRFGGQKDTADDFRLVTEILAEAGRNPRIAQIYRCLDDRVGKSLSAALVALAPHGTGSCTIESLVELILTLGAGTACRQIVHKEATSRATNWIIEKILACDADTPAKTG
ncbi:MULTISPECIES: TetR/AcrR family transcriptional regulator [unclassified Sphingobium]|uniref:TetR/AcrR family transcriptional regulator n=1 Tax=unclassified Sphingobium TaxID=2611147 RepID=UPI001305104F|nr:MULTISPECIES: TetR/AcrR family transcriptional regulator [unclassified Sphingobium]